METLKRSSPSRNRGQPLCHSGQALDAVKNQSLPRANKSNRKKLLWKKKERRGLAVVLALYFLSANVEGKLPFVECRSRNRKWKTTHGLTAYSCGYNSGGYTTRKRQPIRKTRGRATNPRASRQAENPRPHRRSMRRHKAERRSRGADFAEGLEKSISDRKKNLHEVKTNLPEAITSEETKSKLKEVEEYLEEVDDLLEEEMLDLETAEAEFQELLKSNLENKMEEEEDF